MSDTTTATLSPEEMEAIRQRHAAAVRCCLPANGTQIERIVRTRTPLPPEVTAFLNAAWQDIPALDAHAAALTRELEAARAEVERLKPFEPMIRGDITEPTIYAARGFFAQLVSSFDAMNGEANYSVTEVQTADNPHAYEVTVRRKDKPTPHDLRKQAEKERDALADRVAELERAALSPPPSPPPGTAAADRTTSDDHMPQCNWHGGRACDCGASASIARDAAPTPAAATPAPATGDLEAAAARAIDDYVTDDDGKVSQYAIAWLAHATGRERPEGVSPMEWAHCLRRSKATPAPAGEKGGDRA